VIDAARDQEARPAPDMRISSRLIRNALTTYLRLGTTFLIGIFLTWYLIGEVGLVGFGMVSLATGALGLSAIDNAVRQSIVRELAAAVASGRPRRLERALASTLALCAVAAILMALVFLGLGAAAGAGFFRTSGDGSLDAVLGWLFVAEGIVLACGTLLAPYTQAVYAAQRLGVENALAVVQRCVNAVAAVLALALLWPNGSVAERLLGFAWLRCGLVCLETAGEAVVARLLVPGLRLRLAAFDRRVFRAASSTVWNAAQVTLSGTANHGGIAVLVNLFFGITYNGVWQVMSQVGGHVRMIGQALLRGIDPLSTHLQRSGAHATILDLMGRSIRYQLLAVAPVGVAYAIFLVPVLDLWVGGRLRQDVGLVAAGIDVSAAIGLTAAMGAINILAEALRMATRGVERMLFGLGHVRAYAWFARYSALLALGGSALFMWLTGSPVWAPVPLVVVNFVFYDLIVLRAAARLRGLAPGATLVRALPRPAAVTAIVALPMLLLRLGVERLDAGGLAGLLVLGAVLLAAAGWWVGLEPGERRRLVQIMSRRHSAGTGRS
jgi:O-antigen/teichoic acid export membrane protein